MGLTVRDVSGLLVEACRMSLTRTITTSSSVDLRELRQARGLSQENVARLADCSTSMVRQLERGYIPAGSAVLPRLLEALNEEGRPDGNETPSDSSPGTGRHNGSYS
jgi:DNA-binding transcriptional regulator YiaG